MPKRASNIAIPSLAAIDRTGGLAQQLAQGLRAAIRRGELKAGERLPSTRALAASLRLARGTVVEAFEQLEAEGYLESRTGAGTRVTASLADELTPSPPKTTTSAARVRLPPQAQRLAQAASHFAPLPPVPFAVGVPLDEVAPGDSWRRLGNRVRLAAKALPSGYGDPKGLAALRVEIADYVRRARAVACDAEQVLITSGTQQGLYLAARVLLAPGDAVWAEDPAYPGMTAVLADFGVDVCRVPVDAQGIAVAQGIALAPKARAAFVTPSHQYPLGVPMSMSRRLLLLDWARQNDAWVVEDDYDSELRYAGHPFPSLQGLEPSRVVYLGTLSKVLFPSLRLGYAIVPQPLVTAFVGARAIMDRGSPLDVQHVVAEYMRAGLLDAHTRRIRAIYADRRRTLIDAIERELHPWLTVEPGDQGMHLVAWLKRGFDDRTLATDALAAGIALRPVSTMYAKRGRPGFIMGFGGFSADAIVTAVRKLKAVLKRTPED
jgi:GntR family transcriptional regulator/MocR family aminotransferase